MLNLDTLKILELIKTYHHYNKIGKIIFIILTIVLVGGAL